VRYFMSFWLGFALAAGLWLASGWRGDGAHADFADLAGVEDWMAHYHLKPEPRRLPQAIETLARAGALEGEARLKPVAAFVAALIGEDDATLASLSEAIAEACLAKQRLLAQAIAMSGRPQWRRLLTELKRAVPARALEIETLLAAPEAPVTLSAAFDEGGVVVDMVFAHFMATGSEAAFRRILAALAGHFAAGDPAAASSAEKAKVTLSSRVGDDPRLLEVVHREADAREEPLAELLRGVLVAAAAQARGRPSGN
jgi:hypothetical protein